MKFISKIFFIVTLIIESGGPSYFYKNPWIEDRLCNHNCRTKGFSGGMWQRENCECYQIPVPMK
ncbi:CLUMA_CG018643, isoform A [Clunio marinus]|uniref:CLUMA_CG018643, isoform A n=1 Tax=Clunio marinus TaxID=568069 RepID=A0A1J1IXN5_9DIPT|nr:CLUMA_CG018643, isoform A [Clunio marinus]